MGRAIRVATVASAAVVAGGAAYLLSLLLNIPGGFPMPPSAATRVVASLSVFASAPALAVFAWAMKVMRPSTRTNASFAIALAFAAVAVANRVGQLLVLGLAPDHAQQLDLYVTNSFMQVAEMVAWGWLFGAASLLVSGAVRYVASAWPARLLAASGVMSLAAGLVYFAALVATLPDWIGGIAVAIGGLAWGIVWPLSAALFMSAGRSRLGFAGG